MVNKAIAFTVFNREDFLKRTLYSWSKVKYLDEYDIYFFVEPSNKINQILEIISSFKSVMGSRNIMIKINNELKGCSANTFQALNLLFKVYDFVVLAEDDLIVSDDVCQYFNYLEDRYRDSNDVCIISANNKTKNMLDNNVVMPTEYFEGYVWGTWSKCWKSLFSTKWNIKEDGGDANWDWNIGQKLKANNLKCIHPAHSKSQHIGINGINSNPEIFDHTLAYSFKDSYEWETLQEFRVEIIDGKESYTRTNLN